MNSAGRLLSACAMVMMVAHVHAAEIESKPLFTILYTAESHAALLPCDCPLQPLGGVARRATIIKRFRERGPVLLIDGGGWAAGGIYDEDSDGEAGRDALRTRLMRDAMRIMKYDAIVLGPEEAKFVKTLSDAPAEVLAKDSKSVKSAAIEIALHGWSEPGLGLLGWTVETPAASSQQPFPGMQSPIQCYISRLGEQKSESILGGWWADLVFIAGRKNTQRTDWRVASREFVNFDYQARNLIVVDVFKANVNTGARYEFRARLEPLGKDIPDDPEIAALLAPHREALAKKGKKRIDIEYWMMPECPGCKLARPEVQALAQELGERVHLVPHWLVDRHGAELSSLHGENELNEARIQALVAKYYPEKFWDWLAWRAEQRDAAWGVGAEKLGMLAARIEQALNAKEADGLLFADVELSERRRVTATPSLVIGNRLYDGEIDRPHVLGALCGSLDEPKPDACKNAPACFFDAQCRKRGFAAKCVGAGTSAARCDASKPAVKIPATVLVDRDALASNQDKILEALIGDLPGLDVRLLDVSTPEGIQLATAAKVTRLPAYLLDTVAKTEDGYKASVGSVAKEISVRDAAGVERSMLLLREDQTGVGANRIASRPRIKGRADLFVSRFSKNGQEALETALECKASREAEGLTLELHDIVYLKQIDGDKPQLAAKNGVAEVEEAARAMAVRLTAPNKLNAYLLERGVKRGSSYWDRSLQKAGIDAQAIRALAEEPAAIVFERLVQDANLLKSLDAGGEIVLLAENCELISVASRADLRHILERIAARKDR